jgi:hypothetical protein
MRGPLFSLGSAALCGALIGGEQAKAQDLRFAPQIIVEGTAYADAPQFPGQHSDVTGALIFTGDVTWRSEDRSLQFVLEPYLRVDARDDDRTYGDLRRGYLRYFGDGWDMTIGADRVFWGVTESVNVVDVINQRDGLENPDLDEKLGQPMLRFSMQTAIGAFDLYYLPYFREREYPGQISRGRLPLAVSTLATTYDRDGGDAAGDFALRYSNTFGAVDLGLSYFYGTARAPVLLEVGGVFQPRYQSQRQVGLDVQYTADAWLLKLEAADVQIGTDDFTAVATGFEYTFYDLAGSGRDLGLIAEYLYDGRTPGQGPATPFDDDVFLGARVTWNDIQDTEFLAGTIIDRDSGAAQYSVEFQRRIGDSTLLELELRGVDAKSDALLISTKEDTALTLRWSRFF